MSMFQVLVVGVFVVLAVATLVAGWRGTVTRGAALLALGVCGLGSVAVVWPHTMGTIAHELGIGRGADLLLYLTTLVMTVAFFYMYARFRRVERELTLLVRRMAIRNAEGPASAARSRAPTESGAAPRWGVSDVARGA